MHLAGLGWPIHDQALVVQCSLLTHEIGERRHDSKHQQVEVEGLWGDGQTDKHTCSPYVPQPLKMKHLISQHQNLYYMQIWFNCEHVQDCFIWNWGVGGGGGQEGFF